MLEEYQVVVKTRQVAAQPEVVARQKPARPDGWVPNEHNSVADGKPMTRAELCNYPNEPKEGCRVTDVIKELKSKLAEAGVSASDFRCVFCFC